MKILFLIFYLIHFLPIQVIYFLAWSLSKPIYYLAKNRRQIAAANIALCFPEKNAHERKRLLKKNLYHASCMLLEYTLCWYASPRRIKRLVKIENIERLNQLYQEDPKLLILYPHFYGLELGALRLNLCYPIISLFTNQNNKLLNQKIYQGRTRFNDINPVHLIRRNDKIISIIHLLKESNSLFLYLPDQDFGKENSIFVPFFNIPTATTTGVSRISKLTQRKILPIVAIREKHHISLKILEPIENFPSTDVVNDTIQINLVIEKVVRQYPEQYFWLHKRFKTRPEGKNSVY